MVRVMVIFGGRSEEHEVSLASARAIMNTLREEGLHEVIPIGISREGAWLHTGDPMRELEDRARLRADKQPSESTAVRASDRRPPDLFGEVDVVFPVLHGPYGEDGTVQGMLEVLGIPYVGSGVLASAAAMDKVTMKKIFAHHGLPQVRWLGLTRKEWRRDRDRWTREIGGSLGYPCFVKPSNLGSSVGINRADTTQELAFALDTAAELDRRIIVEEGVDAREIEVAVLGNEEPKASEPGEIAVSGQGFYDYEAKYTEGRVGLVAPADVPKDIRAEMDRIARVGYTAIDAAGMARMDFFLERGTGRLLLNEINTIPGFTPTSVYPKLWSSSGLPYDKLLDRLLDLALERHGVSA